MQNTIYISSYMTETLCRSCGSEKLHIKIICEFCNQPINFVCSRCGYITDEKVHVDCRNAEFFVSSPRTTIPGQ
jgi:predicted amidophosphoribosyltransferase